MEKKDYLGEPWAGNLGRKFGRFVYMESLGPAPERLASAQGIPFQHCHTWPFVARAHADADGAGADRARSDVHVALALRVDRNWVVVDTGHNRGSRRKAALPRAVDAGGTVAAADRSSLSRCHRRALGSIQEEEYRIVGMPHHEVTELKALHAAWRDSCDAVHCGLVQADLVPQTDVRAWDIAHSPSTHRKSRGGRQTG